MREEEIDELTKVGTDKDLKKHAKEVKEQCDCKHKGHITHSTKTEGTNYNKGWCSNCKSYVYSEKVFCICCFGKVKHKVHYLRCKRIYNKAIKDNQPILDAYQNKEDIPSSMFVEVDFQKARYHIPVAALVRYSNNGYKRETMDELQSAITKVKNYKAN